MEFSIATLTDSGEIAAEEIIEVETLTNNNLDPQCYSNSEIGIDWPDSPERANGVITDPNSSWLTRSMGYLRTQKAGWEEGSGALTDHRIVLTAAHCVFEFYDPPANTRIKSVALNTRFFPGHPKDLHLFPDNGLRLRYLVWPTKWAQNPEHNRHLDLAMIVLDEDTRPLKPIPSIINLYRGGRSPATTAYGYPQVPPYPAKDALYRIQGTAKEASGEMVVMPNNDFSGGASGGPWIARYNGGDYLAGINKSLGGQSVNFGQWVWDMLGVAQQKRDRG